jgi:hypothetical protein
VLATAQQLLRLLLLPPPHECLHLLQQHPHLLPVLPLLLLLWVWQVLGAPLVSSAVTLLQLQLCWPTLPRPSPSHLLLLLLLFLLLQSVGCRLC